ncbi:hypothetical protein ElyMa_001391400 [Elysia marginata]|uniref:VWFD domain-containing protein n=1 Tax=Elysia marginata TaxID=1093978 RepID=A0AAV4IRL9_9GAST|nr:hypothetical protein ElyMa_001391400 [Elysia marginata]
MGTVIPIEYPQVAVTCVEKVSRNAWPEWHHVMRQQAFVYVRATWLGMASSIVMNKVFFCPVMMLNQISNFYRRFVLEVKNDPMVTTANNETYTLPITCRYLLTHFRTTFTAFFSSNCEVKVYAFNKKNRGKIFLGGIDIALRISTPISVPPMGEASWRVTGQAIGGHYQLKFGMHTLKPNSFHVRKNRHLCDVTEHQKCLRQNQWLMTFADIVYE